VTLLLVVAIVTFAANAVDLEAPLRSIAPADVMLPLKVFAPEPARLNEARDVVFPTSASPRDPVPASRIRSWRPFTAFSSAIGLLFESIETAPPDSVTAPVNVKPS
jgi:hypothetical protein